MDAEQLELPFDPPLPEPHADAVLISEALIEAFTALNPALQQILNGATDGSDNADAL